MLTPGIIGPSRSDVSTIKTTSASAKQHIKDVIYLKEIIIYFAGHSCNMALGH